MAKKKGRKFHKVAVLMGGVSAERDVSLRSGAAVAKGLRTAGYEVVEVDIRSPDIQAVPPDVDAAFIALHGDFGEDGEVQRLLAARGLPFTGSGPAASAAAFDKRSSKKLMAEANIPTPRFQIVRSGEAVTLPLPIVIKPPRQGSSIGMHRVFAEADCRAALADALRFGDEALVESYIEGRELTVGIVNGDALPIVEIVAPGGLYDYEAKYTPGRTRYVCPADIPMEIGRRCQDLACAVFGVLGCRGFARVDFRLSENGELYALELNSIPGFTETSLLPKAALAAGISFPSLCERILLAAEA